jgi:hypothetical protein
MRDREAFRACRERSGETIDSTAGQVESDGGKSGASLCRLQCVASGRRFAGVCVLCLIPGHVAIAGSGFVYKCSPHCVAHISAASTLGAKSCHVGARSSCAPVCFLWALYTAKTFGAKTWHVGGIRRECFVGSSLHSEGELAGFLKSRNFWAVSKSSSRGARGRAPAVAYSPPRFSGAPSRTKVRTRTLRALYYRCILCDVTAGERGRVSG